MNENNLSLVYIDKIGKNNSDYYEYEFYFSETPDIVWGEDWNEQCPSACGDLRPDSSTYCSIKRLKTIIPFSLAQENSCFSMQDCIDGCICLAFENISDYDEYPEPYRIVLKFGEDYHSVETKLASRSQFFVEHIFDDTEKAEE